MIQPSFSAVELARPDDLPRPACRVRLVCGPPAAGKSTFVRRHAGPGDIVIDLDMIARERGLGRDRPQGAVGELLRERNRRLAALAQEPAERLSWVILTAASRTLRQWWRDALAAEEVVVLAPPRAELVRRILADPDRREVAALHIELVDAWLARERADDPGTIKASCDADGYPLDPVHPWNRRQGG